MQLRPLVELKDAPEILTELASPSDEAKLPLLAFAHPLQAAAARMTSITLPRFWEQYCCSTKPEEGFGARGGIV
jgi:hypothetical protein